MKQSLVPGAQLESLTEAETRAALREVLLEQARIAHGDIARIEETFATDGAGHGSVDVYACPVGMELELRRLLVEAEGATAGAPFVAAAGYVNLYRSGRLIDFKPISAAAGGIPFVLTWGAQQGPVLRNGEILQAELFAGPLSLQVTVQAQGLLRGPPGESNRRGA